MATTHLLSVVIPTFERGAILLETLEYLQQQSVTAASIIVVDQTRYASTDPVLVALTQLQSKGVIDWLRLDRPSIPYAMNKGLMRAQTEWVLFLDDDIRINADFLEQHVDALKTHDAPAQVGCILQPNQPQVVRSASYQQGTGVDADLDFPFNSDSAAQIHNCMAGNLVVHRDSAIECGGFDENFEGAAYRFETEFCRRLIKYRKQAFFFAPKPILFHLKAERGGTRQFANFLTSSSSIHSVGHYYFLRQVCESRVELIKYTMRQFVTALVAKFYLKRPWYLPVRALAELRGIARAYSLHKQGAKLLTFDR